jgi:ABC-2 type transport system ATP-binding protein
VKRLDAVAGAPMVQVDGVTKWFREVVALSEVSFSLGPGITSILGPNGAGKSTLLRLLCGLTAPSQGTVRVYGHNPRRNREIHRYIGLVPQHDGVFPGVTALRFVSTAGVLSGLDDPKAAATDALNSVEIDPDDARPVTAFSKGMRQRVKIAQALVHGPPIVVADEPLNGLDPRQRRRLIDIFVQLASQGRCVIVSSHVLDEVERFGSNVIVVAQGRLAAEGDFHAIRGLMDDRPHRVRLRTDRAPEVAAELIELGVVRGATLVDGGVDLQTEDAAALGRAVAPVTQRLGASLEELTPLDDDLESVFRYLVDPALRHRQDMVR